MEEFLVGSEAARAAGHAPRGPEELLVLEEEDGVALGLYLSPRVAAAAEGAYRTTRARASPRGPRSGTSPARRRASRTSSTSRPAPPRAGRSVLELEVQAEVDKFALLLLHLWRRGLRRMSPALRRRCSNGSRYHGWLGQEERARYEEANRLGGGYARWLEGRFVEDADVEGLLRELRRTYRRAGATSSRTWAGCR